MTISMPMACRYFLLDGIDATRIDDAYPSNGFERGSRLQTPSVESIEEFRVLRVRLQTDVITTSASWGIEASA